VPLALLAFALLSVPQQHPFVGSPQAIVRPHEIFFVLPKKLSVIFAFFSLSSFASRPAVI
jgi:hypothetical protein